MHIRAPTENSEGEDALHAEHAGIGVWRVSGVVDVLEVRHDFEPTGELEIVHEFQHAFAAVLGGFIGRVGSLEDAVGDADEVIRPVGKGVKVCAKRDFCRVAEGLLGAEAGANIDSDTLVR